MSRYPPVSHYLPHREPMLLLDELVDVTEETCHCRVTVSRDGVFAPFLDVNAHLPAWFGLEIMAQTIGVWSGWHQHEKGAPKIALGMLLSARKLSSHVDVLAAGSVLDIFVTLLVQDERFGGFEAEIKCRDEILSSARLNTYQLGEQELETLLEKGRNA